MASNRFASAFSDDSPIDAAITKVVQEVKQKLGKPAGFGFLFTSGYASAACEDRFAGIAEKLGTDRLIGCNAESVVFNDQEIEGEKCVTLLAGEFGDPGINASVDAFSLKYSRTNGGFLGMPESEWSESSKLIILGDPVSFPMDVFLDWMSKEHPDVEVLGGMCSAVFGNESFIGNPMESSQSVMVCGQEVIREGAVCLRIDGGVKLHSAVSQGCRPIGEPMIVTDCERNEIIGLGGKRAVDKLREIFAQSPTRDQQIFHTGLQLGIAMTEYKEKFGYGDFLIRNLTNIDDDSGRIAVTDYLRKGQTVQLHLRDEHSADADLSQHFDRLTKAITCPQAALLFLCNGRGMNLFSEPNHDAKLLQEKIGKIPTIGFFAAGEIGPVMGKNYLHGFTCVALVFGGGT